MISFTLSSYSLGMILKIVSLIIFYSRGLNSSKGSTSTSSSGSPSSPSPSSFFSSCTFSYCNSSIVLASSNIPIVFMKYAENQKSSSKIFISINFSWIYLIENSLNKSNYFGSNFIKPSRSTHFRNFLFCHTYSSIYFVTVDFPQPAGPWMRREFFFEFMKFSIIY